MLRAYYAWKNGLPFSYVSTVAGSGGDIRYGQNPNRPLTRREGIGVASGPAFLAEMSNSISTATLRTDGNGSPALSKPSRIIATTRSRSCR